jgi:uncharacterized protein YecT (DUF1311 family)
LRPSVALIAAAAHNGAAAVAWAGDEGEPEKNCDGSTYEIVECLKAKTAEWDKRLNVAYKQALEDAQPKQREQLRAAQRLWVQYRDASCLYYGLGEGTIARIEAGYCMKDLTQARAQELESKTERH